MTKSKINQQSDKTKLNIKPTKIEKEPFHFIRQYLRINRWVELICTIFIAVATIRGCSIQEDMKNISDKLERIEDRSASREESRLKAELRPYLIIQLYPEPNQFGSKEYLKRDGNSQLYWDGLHEKINLILPFKIKNVGKVPAVNIEAKYESPSQSEVPIGLVQNNISPEETSEFFHPWVNISSIVGDSNAKQFDVVLRIAYNGNNEIDSRKYCSLLRLTVVKESNSIYRVINNSFEFRYENQ